MNAELCKIAQDKIGNDDLLINMVSTRVRQLNSGGRPLVDNPMLGAADMALTEIVDDKMDYELLHEISPEIRTAKNPGEE